MTSSLRRILFFGLALVVLAGVILVAVTPGTKKTFLIGLGDSYASGEGLAPYNAGSDTENNKCHQSTSGAYSVIAANQLNLRGVNQACSGATIDTMLGDANKAGQLSNSSQAKDIAITIGGNDINALSAVLNPPPADVLAQQLSALQPKLQAAYASIHKAEPLANIFVTGYPDIIPNVTPADCFIKAPAASALRVQLEQLNAVIKNAAAAANVSYVDYSTVFSGHELCSAQPWVNGFDLANVSASLHPNLAGQTAMAAALVTTIKKDTVTHG